MMSLNTGEGGPFQSEPPPRVVQQRHCVTVAPRLASGLRVKNGLRLDRVSGFLLEPLARVIHVRFPRQRSRGQVRPEVTADERGQLANRRLKLREALLEISA